MNRCKARVILLVTEDLNDYLVYIHKARKRNQRDWKIEGIKVTFKKEKECTIAGSKIKKKKKNNKKPLRNETRSKILIKPRKARQENKTYENQEGLCATYRLN